MKTIQLEKSYPGDYAMMRPTDADYDFCLEESAKVLKPDGSLLCVLIKDAVPMEQIASSWVHLKRYIPKNTNRGTATGVKAIKKIKEDGTRSNTSRVPISEGVRSAVLGFYERTPRVPFCRKCSWNEQDPESMDAMLPMFQTIDRIYAEHAPEYYAKQRELTDKTSKDFVIPGTVFTTVTVNKNFRTAVHKDAKNFDAVAPMLLIRQGRFKGGRVVFPEYRVAAQLETGDVIIFRNMVDWHGNTPIVAMSKNSVRCTLVFYYREGMITCGTAEQELELAKNRKAGDALTQVNLNENWGEE